MNHAVTVGDVLGVIMVGGGFLALLAILVWVVWLMNPFRSGH